MTGRDQRPDAFHTEVLRIVEIDADERIVARIAFDLDDTDAAFAELDARYLAGEAAEHAHTWSVITRAYAALNRRELAATTPDWVNIDHRRGIGVARGDLTPYIRTAWDVMSHIEVYIEAVHRLTNLGAVVTRVSKGTSKEGFDAEWREIDVTTVEGDLINRAEKFDDEDIDVALARFDELSAPTPRPMNAALRVYKRLQACFAARDWDAITDMLADDHYGDDRRRVVNAGIRHGRDAELASLQATADIGVTSVTSTAVAIRGNRLALCRTRGTTSGPDPFDTELLRIVEIDADERIAARVVFDLDDIDAAFKELDARYLAGEAADYAHTWSAIAGNYAALGRHELPATTPDWVNIDHRRGGTAFPPGEVFEFLRASWDLSPDLNIYIEAVHRLSNFGVVVTHKVYGTSQEGFDAEWQDVNVLTVEGDLVSRCEVFDEADLDAALARFDELSASTPQIENAATRTWARIADAFNRRDIDCALALTAADGRYEDRRKGLRDKGTARDVWQTVFDAPKGWRLEMEPVAIRGSRLGLTRGRFRDIDYSDRTITVEYLTVTGVSDDDLMHDIVIFDPGDVDSAFSRARRALRSQAKRPPTRTHGRLSRTPMPRSIDASYLRRHRTGRTSTVGAGRDSRPATQSRTSVPRGTSRPTSTSTSRPCIG